MRYRTPIAQTIVNGRQTFSILQGSTSNMWLGRDKIDLPVGAGTISNIQPQEWQTGTLALPTIEDPLSFDHSLNLDSKLGTLQRGNCVMEVNMYLFSNANNTKFSPIDKDNVWSIVVDLGPSVRYLKQLAFRAERGPDGSSMNIFTGFMFQALKAHSPNMKMQVSIHLDAPSVVQGMAYTAIFSASLWMQRFIRTTQDETYPAGLTDVVNKVPSKKLLSRFFAKWVRK